MGEEVLTSIFVMDGGSERRSVSEDERNVCLIERVRPAADALQDGKMKDRMAAVGARSSGFEIEQDLCRPWTLRCFDKDVSEPTGDYLFVNEKKRGKGEKETTNESL
ncbi:hypothetical protein L914_18008 [Phytophthora nicotianae]|uniref:Uncharacterized protein n=1 Tax=Phytophthora nicotianae TaxID=4792 RepID=W2MF98_PHYNI|nr:hypothetical protein L914_18008 [Phytophthora nicotianae]